MVNLTTLIHILEPVVGKQGTSGEIILNQERVRTLEFMLVYMLWG